MKGIAWKHMFLNTTHIAGGVGGGAVGWCLSADIVDKPPYMQTDQPIWKSVAIRTGAACYFVPACAFVGFISGPVVFPLAAVVAPIIYFTQV